jgi:aryl-alcohol dehydrogenase-like predicted oxidoreductase
VNVDSISGLGLGTAPLAFKDVSREQAVRVVQDAVDAGIRLIDTALAYSRSGVESYAESVVAEALRGRPDIDVLVATKGGHYRDGDEFPKDGTPAALRRNVETSLRTLGVERIGLYQLHHVDPSVPLATSVAALAQLRDEGKIAEIGLSNVSIAQLESVRRIAPIASVQNRLSFRHFDDEPTVQHCMEHGVRYLAYSPLAAPSEGAPDARIEIARRHGVSVQQVTLAWLRSLSPVVIPLVGASRSASILDSLGALELRLTPEETDALTSAARARVA